MTSISGAALASLWAELACLLVFSRLLGRLASRVGAPPIVGALLAGVILNREVFGQIWPTGEHWLFPGTGSAGALLGGITNLCLLFVCFLLGIETDLEQLRSLGGRLSLATSSTFVVPFGAGAAFAGWMSKGMIGHSGSRPALIVLVGTATGVSSLPVIAWMVRELALTTTRAGKLAVGVATVQDALGFVLLAVAVAVTGTGGTSRITGVAIGLGVLALFILVRGGRLVGYALTRATRREGEMGAGALTVAFATMLVFAAGSQASHISGALGAFAAGVVVNRFAPSRSELFGAVEAITVAVFVPIYFASAGVSLQFGLIGTRTAVLALIGIVVIGIVGKSVPGWFSIKLEGITSGERAIFATLVNGRGTLQIVIASVALRNAVISEVAFTVIVTAALISSLLAAPVARWFAKRSSVHVQNQTVANS